MPDTVPSKEEMEEDPSYNIPNDTCGLLAMQPSIFIAYLTLTEYCIQGCIKDPIVLPDEQKNIAIIDDPKCCDLKLTDRVYFNCHPETTYQCSPGMSPVGMLKATKEFMPKRALGAQGFSVQLC